MPANRELRIRLNKADDNNEMRNDIAIFEDRVAIMHTVFKDVAKSAFVGVCVYVVLDTFRQVLIARNTSIQVYE